MRRSVLTALAISAGLLTLGACGTDDDEGPAAAVQQSLGRNIRPGQPVVISSACDAGHCTVRYRSGPRGGGVVLSEQAPILSRLFAADDVRSVQLYVHHQAVGKPTKNERPAFATTRCRRADHPEFAWERISEDDIPRRCRTTHVPGGRQRSLIRRGLLTDEEASRGTGRANRGGNHP